MWEEVWRRDCRGWSVGVGVSRRECGEGVWGREGVWGW